MGKLNMVFIAAYCGSAEGAADVLTAIPVEAKLALPYWRYQIVCPHLLAGRLAWEMARRLTCDELWQETRNYLPDDAIGQMVVVWQRPEGNNG